MKKLDRPFYEADTLTVAENLIGKILVHEYDGKALLGRIVETEAYIGSLDKAAHCYNNKMTERTQIMFGEPGHAYVYLIYGMYHCLNVVTEGKGIGAAVLIRALEPLKGLNEMSLNRYNKKEGLSKREIINLTNGPGKLCKAFKIDKSYYGEDLTGDRLYICDDGYKGAIERTKRINIDYAEEAKEFLWRFILKDNKFVSR